MRAVALPTEGCGLQPGRSESCGLQPGYSHDDLIADGSLDEWKLRASSRQKLKAAGSSLAETTAASSSIGGRPQPTKRYKCTVRWADRPPQKAEHSARWAARPQQRPPPSPIHRIRATAQLMGVPQAAQADRASVEDGFRRTTFSRETVSNRRHAEPSSENPPNNGRWVTWGSRGSTHAH